MLYQRGHRAVLLSSALALASGSLSVTGSPVVALALFVALHVADGPRKNAGIGTLTFPPSPSIVQLVSREKFVEVTTGRAPLVVVALGSSLSGSYSRRRGLVVSDVIDPFV